MNNEKMREAWQFAREGLLMLADRIELATGPIEIDREAAEAIRFAVERAEQVVPDGWNRVPVDPTLAMISAGKTASREAVTFQTVCQRVYAAMLATAPEPPK